MLSGKQPWRFCPPQWSRHGLHKSFQQRNLSVTSSASRAPRVSPATVATANLRLPNEKDLVAHVVSAISNPGTQTITCAEQAAGHLDAQTVTSVPVAPFLDKLYHRREATLVVSATPRIVAHSSELECSGRYLAREDPASGKPLLLVRGDDGQVVVYANVCTHKGLRVVPPENFGALREEFICPYHGWSFCSRTGALLKTELNADDDHIDIWTAADENNLDEKRKQGKGCSDSAGKPCYSGKRIEKVKLGLKRLRCWEHLGFIWVCVNDEIDTNTEHSQSSADNASLEQSQVKDVGLSSHLGAWLTADLSALQLGHQVVFGRQSFTVHCNWKLVLAALQSDGHFKRTGSNVTDDLAGPFGTPSVTHVDHGRGHQRWIVPHSHAIDCLSNVATQPLRQWANVIWYLFPNTLLLLQPDCTVVLQLSGNCHDETHITIFTLLPERPTKPASFKHWWPERERLKAHTADRLQDAVAFQELVSQTSMSQVQFHDDASAAFHQIICRLMSQAPKEPK